MNEARKQLVSLEEAMADWRRVAVTCQPTANADYARTVCEEIVRRARILSKHCDLMFVVLGFFVF